MMVIIFLFIPPSDHVRNYYWFESLGKNKHLKQ